MVKLKTLRLKTRTAMNAKISVFVICVETIIYLLLHNLHDCTFKKTMKIIDAESGSKVSNNYSLVIHVS